AEADITESALLQRMLLTSAAARVKPGGRLVYSTCSIESEENEAVVTAFLASDAGQRFSLTSQQTYLPWECGHDGAGVAVLRAS
ncbi:MAG: RNA methyltransferase, partial [Verrucomicrobiota bacterium]